MKQSRFSTLTSRLSYLPFCHRSEKHSSWNGGDGSERSESPPNSDVQDLHQCKDASEVSRHCFDQASDRSQTVDASPSETPVEFVSSIPPMFCRPLAPVIQEFQQLIESDSKLYMLFHQMFDQIPQTAPFDKDPTGKPQVRDYKTMLLSFNEILTQAPEWDQLAHNAGNVSFPFHSILTWPMATPAGMTVFSDDRVNNQFKRMFDVWSTFLASPASRYVLTEEANGWLSPGGLEAMPGFIELFKCDQSAPHYGFKSWDDFFTRQLRDGVRLVASPDDDNVINSACESSVYRIAHNVKAFDTFWIKSQPYSINTMLNHDPLASQFVGGTVYQAFLGPTYYHRWHSPINGRVVKTLLVPGLYYAQSPSVGFVEAEDLASGNPSVSLNFHPDPNAPSTSQSFVTSTSTRALMFIEADNPKIGLMCLMAVGMAEVSTCEITAKEGQKVRKGDEMGMFHFGGSTYCMLFRPDTKIIPTPAPTSAIANAEVTDSTDAGLKFSVQVGEYVHLNSAIATVL